MKSPPTLETLRSAFEQLSKAKDLSLFATECRHHDNSKTIFTSRMICLSPENALLDYAKDLSKRYIGNHVQGKEGEGLLTSAKIRGVTVFSGEWSNEFLAFKKCKDEAVAESYSAFNASFDLPEASASPKEVEQSMAVVKAYAKDNDIYFISKRTPMQHLRHRFFADNNTFNRIETSLLSLGFQIDAVIANGVIFFITVGGAQIFISDHICKTIARKKARLVGQMDFITDNPLLESTALKGLNPRRFLSFDESRMTRLSESRALRKEICSLFGLSVDCKSSKIAIESENDAEKLIKILCRRGMTDPFEQNGPIEVTWSTSWRR